MHLVGRLGVVEVGVGCRSLWHIGLVAGQGKRIDQSPAYNLLPDDNSSMTPVFTLAYGCLWCFVTVIHITVARHLYFLIKHLLSRRSGTAINWAKQHPHEAKTAEKNGVSSTCNMLASQSLGNERAKVPHLTNANLQAYRPLISSVFLVVHQTLAYPILQRHDQILVIPDALLLHLLGSGSVCA